MCYSHTLEPKTQTKSSVTFSPNTPLYGDSTYGRTLLRMIPHHNALQNATIFNGFVNFVKKKLLYKNFSLMFILYVLNNKFSF